MTLDVLSLEDVNKIKAVEQKWSQRAGFNITLEKSLDRWKCLAKECMNGYNDDVSEYTNDLSSREVIEESYDCLSEKGKTELLHLIEPIDDEFISCTVRLRKPAIAYNNINPQKHFWYYRIPKKIKREEVSAFESQLRMSLTRIVDTF